MCSAPCKGLLPLLSAFLLVFCMQSAAEDATTHAATGWLNDAIRQKQCPSTPVNVSANISEQELLKHIRISGHELVIEGTDEPDHIVLSASREDSSLIHVIWNGKHLGRFGPVSGITMRGGGGDDILIAKRSVTLPVLLDGGDGDDCLQGGSGADTLLAGAGDDILIAGTGRPALVGGSGRDRVVVPESMGTLDYGPSADVGVLHSLRTVYDLRPASDQGRGSRNRPGPLVLGAGDLGDEKLLQLAKRVRAAGESVVLTNATEAQVEQLRTALNHPDSAEPKRRSGASAHTRLPLTYFRTARRPGTKAYDYNAGYFARLAESPDDWSTQLLSRVFSATPVVPRLASGGASNDLQKIADSYTSSSTEENQSGDSVHIVNSVWSARSFMNQADFFYVFQEADYFNEETAFSISDTANSLLYLNGQDTAPALNLIQPSPQSIQCSSSTTSGTTWSVGGSAGWNATQGLDAALTGGVSVSNSTTVECPSTLITNQSNPSNGETQWMYQIQYLIGGTLTTTYNQWIWGVPFSAYPPNTQSLKLTSNASMVFSGAPLGNPGPPLVGLLTSQIPLPFGSTFALQNPVVTSVSPTCVNSGNKFTIHGSGFYPSLLTSVLIDGTSLTSSQYASLSDTAVSVTAPNLSGYFLPIVVQTGEGLSNSNVTIEISTFDLCPN